MHAGRQGRRLNAKVDVKFDGRNRRQGSTARYHFETHGLRANQAGSYPQTDHILLEPHPKSQATVGNRQAPHAAAPLLAAGSWDTSEITRFTRATNSVTPAGPGGGTGGLGFGAGGDAATRGPGDVVGGGRGGGAHAEPSAVPVVMATTAALAWDCCSRGGKIPHRAVLELRLRECRLVRVLMEVGTEPNSRLFDRSRERRDVRVLNWGGMVPWTDVDVTVIEVKCERVE